MEDCIYYIKDIAYPLCNGRTDSEDFIECECKNCCLYKDFEDELDI